MPVRSMSLRDNLFQPIAQKELGIETLAARNSDGLDFHSVSVWSVRNAFNAVWHLRDDEVNELRERIAKLEREKVGRSVWADRNRKNRRKSKDNQ
jgi:hypothetical protein